MRARGFPLELSAGRDIGGRIVGLTACVLESEVFSPKFCRPSRYCAPSRCRFWTFTISRWPGVWFNLLPSLLVMKSLSTAQKIGLFHAAILYVVAGVFHFTKTEAYLKIMPPYIPYHVPLVLISGVFEILGGLGLLLPQMRRAAAWGLIALLIAVFPANIYMATNPIQAGAVSVAPALRWARLPLQLLLVWWLLWCTRSRAIFP